MDVAVGLAAAAVAASGGVGGGAASRAALAVAGGAVEWAAYLALVPLPRLLVAVRGAAR